MEGDTPKLMIDDPDPNSPLAFICKMCYKMAAAIENGKSDCGVSACGGPKKGHTFPSYHGPLTKEQKKQYCYRCGKDSGKIIQIKGEEPLGVCTTCADFLEIFSF